MGTSSWRAKARRSVRREIREATGLKVENLSLRGLVSFVYDQIYIVHFLYAAQSECRAIRNGLRRSAWAGFRGGKGIEPFLSA